MYVFVAGLGDDPFPPGKHPSLQVAGLLRCAQHPARVPAGKGKSFKIADRPIIMPNDPRAHAVEMAIVLFFPLLIFNHTFDALFRPEGSVMKTDKGPVIFAVPLDEKIVTDEMIDIAADFVRTGGLDRFVANAAKSAGMILSDTTGFAVMGAKFGYWGAAIGAAIGALKSLLSFFGGDQEYDVPDSLKPYSNKILAARHKRHIEYHFSTDDRDHRCAVLWFDQNGDYTLLEAAQRLLTKLGQSWPGAAASKPTPPPTPRPAVPPPPRASAVPRAAPMRPPTRQAAIVPAARSTRGALPILALAAIVVGAVALARAGD